MKHQVTYTKLDGSTNTIKGSLSDLERKIKKAQKNHPGHDLSPKFSPLEWEHPDLSGEAFSLLSESGSFVIQYEAFHNDSSKSWNGVIWNKTFSDNNGRPFTFNSEDDAEKFHELMTKTPNAIYKISTTIPNS
jgi:hypothetical protein